MIVGHIGNFPAGVALRNFSWKKSESSVPPTSGPSPNLGALMFLTLVRPSLFRAAAGGGPSSVPEVTRSDLLRATASSSQPAATADDFPGGVLRRGDSRGTPIGAIAAADAPKTPTSVDAVENTCFGVGHEILGIDIGGTTIKAAPVDTRTGELLAAKHVIATPQPATPQLCADVIAQMVHHFKWKGAIGVGVPAVVKHGTTWTAANIDPSWVGAEVEALFGVSTGLATTVVNDADAAGYAELGFGSGAGENERGVVFVVTFGTGIGTAMFVDGILVPNLELGHLELDGMEAEAAAAGVLRERHSWTWEQWAERASWYLSYIERLFWPTRFIVGGGVSNAHEEWLHMVKLPNSTPILPATMKNDAGIVGAAMAALARAAYDINRKPQQVEEYINA